MAVLSYLLYLDITRGSGPGSTELIGKIAAKRNMAERKYSAQVVWNEVFKDSDLYNYDTIRTADRSEAVIRLKDGTEITLNENSMILLVYSEKEIDIKFIQGTMNAKQSEVKGATPQKINIESGDSKISLKDGDVSLAQDMDNTLQVTVNRGTATLKTDKEEKVIKENQNIMASEDEIRLFDLTIKLIAPENNRYLQSVRNKAAVKFSWEMPRGAYTTFLEIANNSAVSDPTIKKEVRGAASELTLPDGVYYWRVTAVNAATKKVEMSEIRKVSILDNRPVTLIAPANKTLIKYRDANPLINFLWSRNENFSRYNLVISGSADMAKPVIDTTVEGNKISLSTLTRGTYFWRVGNVQENDQIESRAVSPVFTFTISKTDKLEPPEPLYPADKKSIHPMSIVQKGLGFSWIKPSSIPLTEITIARDRDLSTVLIKKRIDENFIRFFDKFEVGDYYWGLKGIMRDGSTTDPSRVMRFRVVEHGSISLIEPKNGTVIVTNDADTGSKINFTWSKTDIEGAYIVQLARDKNFKEIFKETTISGLSTELSGIIKGRYFWRVKLIDDAKAVLLVSPEHTFELLSLLTPPAAIGPLQGSTVDMLKRDTLDFSWKPVRGANLYKIGLYQVKGLIKYSIANMETRNTLYKFGDLKKLDVGKFVWTLQAVETDPATNRVRRQSDEIQIPFKITLGIRDDFQFKVPEIIHTE